MVSKPGPRLAEVVGTRTDTVLPSKLVIFKPTPTAPPLQQHWLIQLLERFRFRLRP